MIVRVEIGPGCGVIRDEPLQSWGVCILYNASGNLIALSVFHANYSRLAGSATSSVGHLFALCLAHVLALATKIGLVYFNRPVEGAAVSGRPMLHGYGGA